MKISAEELRRILDALPDPERWTMPHVLMAVHGHRAADWDENQDVSIPSQVRALLFRKEWRGVGRVRWLEWELEIGP